MYYTLVMERKNKPRGVMYALAPLFIFYAVNLAVSTIFLFILSRYMGVDMSSAESLDAAMEYSLQYAYELETAMCLCITAVLLPGFLKNERKEHDLLYENRLSFKDVLCSALYGVALYLTVDVLLVMVGGFVDISEMIEESEEAVSPVFTGTLLMDMLLLGVISPVSEEIMVRGVMFNRLRSFMDENDAVMLTAILFGVMHLGSVLQMFYTFLMGYVITKAYSKYENILVPILMHAFFNLSNFITDIPYMDTLLETKTGLLVYYFVAVALATFTVKSIWKKEKPSLRAPSDTK